MKSSPSSRKTVRRLILWALVIGWMCLIFAFSCETADRSGKTSGGFIRSLLITFDTGFSDLDEAAQTARVESLDFFVRKSAHFSLFAVLGLLCAAAYSVDLRPGTAFLLALLTGALYAVSDEAHQYFVPGRACQLRDMVIDTCGTAVGAGFFTAVRLLVRRRMRRSKKKDE